MFDCPYCDKSYKSKDALRTHRNRHHRKEVVESQTHGTVQCPVTDCRHTTHSRCDLGKHLTEEHGDIYNMCLERHVFDTEIEFNDWLGNLHDEGSVFVKTRGEERNKDGSKSQVLHCMRDGDKKANKLKHPDTIMFKQHRDTCKTGQSCPAFVKKKILPSGSVIVEANLHHFGHTLRSSMKHTTLPRTVVNTVVAMLAAGYSDSYILNEVRGDEDLLGCRRSSMFAESDLARIKNSNPLTPLLPSQPDHVSLESFLQTINGDVVYYQPHTADKPMSLCIQSQHQKRLMVEYGSHLVAMDGTHGMSKYEGYILSTVLVVGPAGEAEPVAYLMCEGESQNALEAPLCALTARLPKGFTTKYFVSDLARSFFNSWQAAFGPNNGQWIVCHWHLWRAWTDQLSKKVDSDDDRTSVRAALSVLLSSLTETEFMANYEKLVKDELWHDPATHEFADYIATTYPVEEGAQWALYGRRDGGLTHNLHLESYHNVVKGKFLMRRSMRMDKLVYTLASLVSSYYKNRNCAIVEDVHADDVSIDAVAEAVDESASGGSTINLEDELSAHVDRWEKELQTLKRELSLSTGLDRSRIGAIPKLARLIDSGTSFTRKVRRHVSGLRLDSSRLSLPFAGRMQKQKDRYGKSVPFVKRIGKKKREAETEKQKQPSCETETASSSRPVKRRFNDDDTNRQPPKKRGPKPKSKQGEVERRALVESVQQLREELSGPKSVCVVCRGDVVPAQLRVCDDCGLSVHRGCYTSHINQTECVSVSVQFI